MAFWIWHVGKNADGAIQLCDKFLNSRRWGISLLWHHG